MANNSTAQAGSKENTAPTASVQPLAPSSKNIAGTAGMKRGLSCVSFEEVGSRKQNRTDPLVHHGRHFGRTIRTFCRVQALINNGLAYSVQLELGRAQRHDLSLSEQKDLEIYEQLLGLSSGLEERLCTGSEQEVFYVASMITKGASSARSDDTKSLKSVVVDWITPINGNLTPPIQRNIKADRGFHHDVTGELLCPVTLNWHDASIRHDLKAGTLVPSGDMWPRFIYYQCRYNPRKPWDGLLRSKLLISAYKHIFTSPSSVGVHRESRATRSCNAVIHGMKSVTVASIAYVATQLRFALSSSATFSRTDKVSDSEFFYTLIIELLEDPEEAAESKELLSWWDRQIFPSYLTETRTVHNDSVFAMIKQARLLEKENLPSSSTSPQRRQGTSTRSTMQVPAWGLIERTASLTPSASANSTSNPAPAAPAAPGPYTTPTS